MSQHFSVKPATIIALFTLMLLAPFSFAASNPVPEMARIVAALNHYPSAEQKETLAAISQDEKNSEASRTIAQAIHNIEHKAKADDVAALQAIVDGSSASDAEKQLAGVVIGINHTASAEAKKTLEALSK